MKEQVGRWKDDLRGAKDHSPDRDRGSGKDHKIGLPFYNVRYSLEKKRPYVSKA
jgi:hypothetical protein